MVLGKISRKKKKMATELLSRVLLIVLLLVASIGVYLNFMWENILRKILKHRVTFARLVFYRNANTFLSRTSVKLVSRARNKRILSHLITNRRKARVPYSSRSITPNKRTTFPMSNVKRKRYQNEKGKENDIKKFDLKRN